MTTGEFIGGPMDGELQVFADPATELAVLRGGPQDDPRHNNPDATVDIVVVGKYVKAADPPRVGDPWAWNWEPA